MIGNISEYVSSMLFNSPLETFYSEYSEQFGLIRKVSSVAIIAIFTVCSCGYYGYYSYRFADRREVRKLGLELEGAAAGLDVDSINEIFNKRMDLLGSAQKYNIEVTPLQSAMICPFKLDSEEGIAGTGRDLSESDKTMVVINLLLDKGADVNQKAIKGRSGTPLYIAICQRNFNFVERLCDANVRLNEETDGDLRHDSPALKLIIDAKYGSKSDHKAKEKAILEFLLRKGAELKDENNITSLEGIKNKLGIN